MTRESFLRRLNRGTITPYESTNRAEVQSLINNNYTPDQHNFDQYNPPAYTNSIQKPEGNTAAAVGAALGAGGSVTGSLISSLGNFFANRETNASKDKIAFRDNQTREHGLALSAAQFDKNLEFSKYTFEKNLDLSSKSLALDNQIFKTNSQLQKEVLAQQKISSLKFGTPFGSTQAPLFGTFKAGGFSKSTK